MQGSISWLENSKINKKIPNPWLLVQLLTFKPWLVKFFTSRAVPVSASPLSHHTVQYVPCQFVKLLPLVTLEIQSQIICYSYLSIISTSTVREHVFTSQSTTKSFWKRVFPGNKLH